MKKANEIYNTLNEVLLKFGRSHYEKYEKNEDSLLFNCVTAVQGVRIPFSLLVAPKRELIILTSQLDVTIPATSLVDVAIAVCKINQLYNGRFEFDLSDYKIKFKEVCSYRASVIGRQALEEMIYGALGIISFGDGIFKKLANGEITHDDVTRLAIEKSFGQ